MKKRFFSILLLILALCCAGCSSVEEERKIDRIPFDEDQLYAVAYLGYGELADLNFYTETYLDSDTLPIHYFSSGDYYLILPRYENMAVALYRNDMDTMEKSLVYESKNCEPFLLQCNISDIFSDVTVCLQWQEETVEFSPYISLMDGSVQVGERGLDITNTQ